MAGYAFIYLQAALSFALVAFYGYVAWRVMRALEASREELKLLREEFKRYREEQGR